MPLASLETVLRFSRLVVAATDPDEILRLLASWAVERLRAAGAAVLLVTGAREAKLAALAGPLSLGRFSVDADDLGPAAGQELARLAGFKSSRTIPLVADGDLFGVLVLLFDGPVSDEAPGVVLAHALSDLAAIALGRARDYQRLSRALEERNAARDELARTEKLRALGQMAAGISHDLRNLLNPLGLQLQLLRKQAHDPARVEKVVSRLERVYRRGLDTVERLRLFSRQSPEGELAELADLDVLAGEAVELSSHRVHATQVELRVERGRPPPVHLPTSELVAAIVNLVSNAIDALPAGGGTVTLRTGESEAGAWIQVRDTGTGIPDEVRAHLFEPFVTTKGKKGTGLGLWMVRDFVERHGGTIAVQSERGQGTTITLAFPPARPEVSPPPPAA